MYFTVHIYFVIFIMYILTIYFTVYHLTLHENVSSTRVKILVFHN